MSSQRWNAFIDWLKTCLEWLKASLAASEEYAVFRRIFKKLCLFVAIVILTLIGSGVMAMVKYFVPHATPILSYMENLVVLADGLVFFGLLVVEVVESLVRAGLLDATQKRKAAVAIMIVLAGGAWFLGIEGNVESALSKMSRHVDQTVAPVKPPPSSTN